MKTIAENLIQKGSFWLPRPATQIAHDVDTLFYTILWFSVAIFLAMFIIGLVFVVKYKRTSTNTKAEKHVTHNNVAEILWTVIPLILLMIVFWWGYQDYLKLSVAPPNTMDIKVTGKKWFWSFNYPKEGINTLNEFVVPVNTPVRLIMASEDVIHSMFIPNFRVKKDVIPNRYTTVWFEASDIGIYQVFCTEYCGDGHSSMSAILKVMSQADYDRWLQSNGEDTDTPLPELGKKLYTAKACNTCHSIDGSVKVGPSWKAIYNSDRQMADGSSVKADDNYIRESVVNPQAKVVKGFAPVMPAYAGLLSDREIDAIIEYIKSLK
ncbi:cytochrome c oxidase subunit II [Candidatus Marinamargulisbacteria bacterium SCGC AAA071-K20]|nr:cytochrome c oxidase subunit II [Candidatus Marinamargulisbacteria bacterium SCGC AAA071-K20]